MTAINDRADVAQVMTAVSSDSNPSPSWQMRYGRRLLFSDLLAIVFAVSLAQLLRFGWPAEALQNYLSGSGHNYLMVSGGLVFGWLAALTINQSRSPRIIGSGAEEYRRVVMGTFAVFGALAIISLLFKLHFARGYLLIALPTGLGLVLLTRWLARRVLTKARLEEGKCITRLLAVGSPSAVRDLTESLAREPWSGFEVVGACITGATEQGTLEVPGAGTIPVFGNESTIVGALTATGGRAVAVTATEHLDGRGMRDLSWELEKLDVDLMVSPGVVDVAGPRLQIRPVAGLPLIYLEKPQYHGAKRFEKRLFDVTFASTALLCTLPLLVVIAVAIKLTSKGTVFYRQERIGLNGRPFEMVKFRTMVADADSMVDGLAHLNECDGGVLFKIRNDPRVTRVGRVLRKYSLDELPQFINVLRREMSVVGPRPPLPSEVKTYSDYAKRRLLVRPGITGLWQVSGRSDLSWEDSVRLDLFYVENWSMISDLLIALKTAKVVFTHSGAY
jgi:exopolysaccharide biosynthesis polyprenyl glycosylphosphotransferase